MKVARRVAVVLFAAGVLWALAGPALAAPQSVVSGTVYGSDGVVIPGATVTVAEFDRRVGVYVTVASLATNGSGWWTYGGKAGDYKFDFAAPSSDPATRYLSMVNRGVYSLDVTLQSYGSISGAIADRVTALPLAGATVDFYRKNTDGTWPTVAFATLVTPDGAYASLQLPTGQYRVRATAVGYAALYYGESPLSGPAAVAVNRGSAMAGTNIALSPAISTATITGRVLSGALGTPRSGINVWFYRQNDDGTWPPTSPGWGSPTKGTTTDSAGNYTSGELPVGYYKVRFFNSMIGSQWWMYVATVDAATVVPLTVPGDTVSGIEGWFGKPL